MDISKIKIQDLELVLNKYAERANHLYKKLFLTLYPINNIEDAQRYIDESKEYRFISDLFRHLCIYDWLKV